MVLGKVKIYRVHQEANISVIGQRQVASNARLLENSLLPEERRYCFGS